MSKKFWRHYLEMVAAMVIGMMVLGSIRMLATEALGWSSAFERVEPMALAMAVEMSVGMAAWMRYRRHGWAPILEMSAAMVLSFVVLFIPLWLGILGADGVIIGGHVLMLPAMAAVMLRRREEYAGHHHTPTAVTETGRARTCRAPETTHVGSIVSDP